MSSQTPLTLLRQFLADDQLVDEMRWKRKVPSTVQEKHAQKRQAPTSPPLAPDCCENVTKGEKGTQGELR